MRPAEHVLFVATTLACCNAGYCAEPPAYGQVETFAPGKKYNCVPTADHKGWDCSEVGTGKPAPQHAPAQPPVAAPPVAAPAAPPVVTPVAETPSAVVEKSVPAPAAPAAVMPAPPAAPAPPVNSRSSELPSYLTNAAASAHKPAPPPARAAAPVAPPRPPQSAPPPSPPEPAPPPVQTTPRTAQSAPPESAVTAPAPAPKAAPPPVTPAPARPADLVHSGDFLNLPGDRFVVELAHGTSAGELAATRASLHPSRGDLYTVHLRQNGADTWLLVWGSFDSIEAARTARSEIAAQGTITPGWPRRIAPLQAEARRTVDQ